MKNKVEYYPVIYQPREHKLYVHIRNTPNSKGVYKKYFGVTCQTISARWGKNGKKYAIKNKDGEYTKFYKAILKHGWNEGFRHIVLFKNLTKSEAYSLEYFFVKTYDTLKKGGYNSKEGGISGTWSEDTRKKFSENKKGKPVPNFEKMWVKGELNPLYGTKRPPELVRQIAEHFMIPIYCVEQDKWYKGISEASLLNNIKGSSMSACCRQNTSRMSAGGLHWVYKLDDIKNIKFKPIKIYTCVETGEKFYSSKEIKDKFNISVHPKDCNQNKIRGGYHWKLIVIDKNLKEYYTNMYGGKLDNVL